MKTTLRLLFISLFFSAGAMACAQASGPSQTKAEKPRFFVLTDVSDEEPDDKQSLVRLFLYASDYDLEGLVATTSQWKGWHRSTFKPEYIGPIIDAYQEVEDNLRLHHPDYPSARYLRSLVATGNGNNMEAVGEGFQSEGAEMLCQSILRKDPRPLWVGVWGGASTLAQALWALRGRMDEAELQPYLEKLWVFDIQGQDDAGAWIAVNFPEVHYLRCQFAWRGMSYHVKDEWFETRGGFEEYVSPDWFRVNIQENHGPLGQAYPSAVYLHEGDSPSILHLIGSGLHDPLVVDQGGWGGRYEAQKQQNVWSGGCPVSDESRFGRFYMYSDAHDRYQWERWSFRTTRNAYNPVMRWRDAYQNDFAARMDWCTQSVAEANHRPTAVVNGDHSLQVIFLKKKAGETLRLDASGSTDPDGDSLTYHWWHYPDPGTYPQELTFADANQPVLEFDLPGDAAGTTLHLILSLTDGGEPALTSYRRVVVSCK